MLDLSNAILLAQHNEVIALDIIQEKVDMINEKKSPIVDAEIEEYLATKELNLVATTDVLLLIKMRNMSLFQHQRTMTKNLIILIHVQ